LKVKEELKHLPKGHLGKRLVGSDTFNGKQLVGLWFFKLFFRSFFFIFSPVLFVQEVLEKINTVMQQDYSVRRGMLLKRLDVTVQSFLWEDRAQKDKGKRDAEVREGIQEIMRNRRGQLVDHVRFGPFSCSPCGSFFT